jgi:hypothetical protein
LFCTQCGQEIPEQARFCGHCGAPVAVRAAAELAGEPTERQSEWPANPADRQEPAAAPNPIDDPDEEVRAFVQRNADYYLRKWSKTPDPGKGIGWNWAAFFLPYFWLGYRKQYVALFGLAALWLAIDIVDFAADLGMNNGSIGLSISAGCAISANSWYYRYVTRQIGKVNQQPTAWDRPVKLEMLARKGGTSWKGVFLSIGLLLTYMFIYMFVLFPNYGKTEIEFGRSESGGIVRERTTVFEEEAPIHYSFEFPGNGGHVEVVLEVREGSTSQVVERWPLDVPPDWPGVHHSFYAPETGKYTLKIIKDDRVISKGKFTVEK